MENFLRDKTFPKWLVGSDFDEISYASSFYHITVSFGRKNSLGKIPLKWGELQTRWVGYDFYEIIWHEKLSYFNFFFTDN